MGKENEARIDGRVDAKHLSGDGGSSISREDVLRLWESLRDAEDARTDLEARVEDLARTVEVLQANLQDVAAATSP